MSTSLIAAVLLHVSAAAPAAHQRVALLVGANQAIADRQPLQFARRDAAQLASALVDVAGFAADDVLVLEDPEPGEVTSALERLQGRLANAGQDTVLLFYFSGHADGQALYTQGMPLALKSLREQLEASPATLRLGIVDACSGGAWTRAKGLAPAAPELVPVPLLASEGAALLASSSGLERAHESDELQGSFFTHHLVAALRGAADQTPAGEVTLQAAFRYAQQRTVTDSALHAREPQHPSFSLNLRGRDDVVLSRPIAAASALEVAQEEGPLTVLQLPSGTELLELEAGQRRTRLAVAPGRYLVRRVEGSRVFAREVAVAAGATVVVDEAALSLLGAPRLASKEVEPDLVHEFGRSEVSFGSGLFAVGPFNWVQNQWLVTGSVQRRLGDVWALRARADYQFIEGIVGAWVDVQRELASGGGVMIGGGPLRVIDWSLALEGGFVPVVVWLGAERRLEVQVSLGTGVMNVRTETFSGGYPSGRNDFQWTPVTASPAVRLFLWRHVAVEAESELTWAGGSEAFARLKVAVRLAL